MKLLLIEDNPTITGSLYYLLHPSYVVHSAPDGQSGLDRAIKGNYDLIILDLNLPDMPGQMVCERLRAKGAKAPILILSGNADVDSKATLLDRGANDYVTKPFASQELLARVRVLLRQSVGRQTTSQLACGDLLLDTKSRTASRQGRPIYLRRKEYDLLECLAINSGQVVPHQLLASYVWSETEETSPNNLQVQINQLRRKIDLPFKKPIIKTVHGIGYMLSRPDIVPRAF